VSLLERGRINITVNTARQIAHVLEISRSELFRGLN
jgi:DNA-binding XRE family transcriptional regulator